MKKSILIAGILLGASLVQAEVLSWRVDIPDTAGGNTFVTARLFATQLTSSQNYWEDVSSQQGTDASLYSNPAYGVLRRDTTLGGGVNSSYNFFVGLFDTGGVMVKWSHELMSWTDLATYGALVSGNLPDLPATPWNAGIGAVPEPTSMALLALGVSAMMLRRKRSV